MDLTQDIGVWTRFIWRRLGLIGCCC